MRHDDVLGADSSAIEVRPGLVPSADIGYSDEITPVLAVPEAHVPDGSRAG
jgi:hypothetical protein